MAFTHENESQFVGSQLGIETAWGTEVPATVRLGSVDINPALKRTFVKHKVRGQLFNQFGAEATKWGEHSFEGYPTFEELEYFVKDVVTHQQSDPVSYTLEAGGEKFVGAVIDSWQLEGTQEDIRLSGTMISKNKVATALTSGLSVPTLTPVPAIGTAITIGGITYTKWIKWSLGVSGLWELAWLGGSETPANVIQGTDANGSFSLMLEKDATSAGLIDLSGRQAVTITMTLGAMSVTLGATVILEEPDAFEDSDGIYAFTAKGDVYNVSPKSISVVIDKTA